MDALAKIDIARDVRTIVFPLRSSLYKAGHIIDEFPFQGFYDMPSDAVISPV